MSFLLFFVVQNCHAASTSSMVMAAQWQQKDNQFRGSPGLMSNSDILAQKSSQRAMLAAAP
jgi:hypothetical protein